jgi:hypothetical protein
LCTDNLDESKLKENVENAYDPDIEILPARIPQHKPHCPRCGVTVTDIGTCPYCETKVNPRSYNKISGDINQVKFIETKIKPNYPFKPLKTQYEVIKKTGKFSRHTVAFKKIVTFLNFKITFFNFDIENHRQNGGPVNYQTTPRLSSDLVENEKALVNKKSVPIFKIKRAEPCICGCESNIVDNYHGQILCPECGLVHERLFVLPGSDFE